MGRGVEMEWRPGESGPRERNDHYGSRRKWSVGEERRGGEEYAREFIKKKPFVALDLEHDRTSWRSPVARLAAGRRGRHWRHDSAERRVRSAMMKRRDCVPIGSRWSRGWKSASARRLLEVSGRIARPRLICGPTRRGGRSASSRGRRRFGDRRRDRSRGTSR